MEEPFICKETEGRALHLTTTNSPHIFRQKHRKKMILFNTDHLILKSSNGFYFLKVQQLIGFLLG